MMYSLVSPLAIVAAALSIVSIIVLTLLAVERQLFARRMFVLSVLGWGLACLGWALLSAYLLAPIWFRLLTK